MENILLNFSRDLQVYETPAPVPNLPHARGVCLSAIYQPYKADPAWVIPY